MRFILSSLIALSLFTSATARDFNPADYGLIDPERLADIPPPLPKRKCVYVRDAEGVRAKVWSCDDGKVFYGMKDIWSTPDLPEQKKAEDPEVKPFDPVIRLESGKAMLTIRHWVNNRYCRTGKPASCSGREILSVSHMIVDKDECDTLGEKLAYKDFVTSGRPDHRIKISWYCD